MRSLHERHQQTGDFCVRHTHTHTLEEPSSRTDTEGGGQEETQEGGRKGEREKERQTDECLTQADRLETIFTGFCCDMLVQFKPVMTLEDLGGKTTGDR